MNQEEAGSQFLKQIHENAIENCGYNDGQAYGQLYNNNPVYGGIPLQQELEIIAEAAGKEYDNPDDKVYFEAYQRGFKDILKTKGE